MSLLLVAIYVFINGMANVNDIFYRGKIAVGYLLKLFLNHLIKLRKH